MSEFEQACRAANVQPVDALVKGGLHRSTWFRWKATSSSPTYRNIQKAHLGLEALRLERPAA